MTKTLPLNKSAEQLLGAILAAFEAGKIEVGQSANAGHIIVPVGGRLLLGYALKRGANENVLTAEFNYKAAKFGDIERAVVTEINWVKVVENDYICPVTYSKGGAGRLLYAPLKQYSKDCLSASAEIMNAR